jgi:hypothetical protein
MTSTLESVDGNCETLGVAFRSEDIFEESERDWRVVVSNARFYLVCRYLPQVDTLNLNWTADLFTSFFVTLFNNVRFVQGCKNKTFEAFSSSFFFVAAEGSDGLRQ